MTHTQESDRTLIERMRDALKNTDHHSMYATEVAEATARLAASEGDCPDALSEIADEIEATYPTADASNLRKLGKTAPPAEAAKVGELSIPTNDSLARIVYELRDASTDVRSDDFDAPLVLRHWADRLAAIAALQQPSDKLTDEQVAQHVIDLVGPLCDRGTFEAPDWAIACLHAAVNWDKPEGIGKLATTPPQPSPSADVRQQTQTGEHIATLESMLLDDHGWIPGIGERVALRWAIAVLRQSPACAESRREDLGWPHWRDM